MEFWYRLLTSMAEKRPETVEEWKRRKKEEFKYLWVFGGFFLFIFIQMRAGNPYIAR